MKDPSELTNNSLATLFPEIASQWDYEKNGDLTPANIPKGSRQKVWWICKNGHEYQAKVYHRTHAGSGCPYCINHKTIPGKNDLPTRFPEIFVEWDYEKNYGTDPTLLRTRAPERFWWVCPKGHHYQAKVFDRIYSKSGCTICTSKAVEVGKNDLATLHPEIASLWHPTKNGDLRPEQFLPGSKKKVWWSCSNNHAYERTIADQVSRNAGCPYCKGKKLLSGFNDLATLYPDIAAQWHPTRNGELKPDQVLPGTEKKAWWLCPKKHEYETYIYLRRKGCGCPYCINQKLLRGYNDLETVSPDLATEWHPTFNGDLTPRDVLTGSNRKYWWQCMQGHSWCTSISHRQNGRNCPVCAKAERMATRRKTEREKKEAKYAAILLEQQS